MKTPNAALAALLIIAAPLCARASALEELGLAGGDSYGASAVMAVPQASPAGMAEAEQYLPPDNNEPGFEWPGNNRSKGGEVNYFYTGSQAAFLKASPDMAADLAEGTGRCALAPNTRYNTLLKPGFEGEHMTVRLAEPLPGCQLASGYVYMSHVSSSSAGGLWELPKTVRAFMDTLAYSEGTKEHYDYIFTYVTFTSYADHPRRIVCSGRLCSSAAGRYQFLSKTWDALAADLALTDFTPPNQEKACLELVRRAGAYELALKADKPANFKAAVKKINTIWASLPGSPYGQPTHSMTALWEVYQEALARY
jgi:muramidase (phage lysozyme)